MQRVLLGPVPPGSRGPSAPLGKVTSGAGAVLVEVTVPCPVTVGGARSRGATRFGPLPRPAVMWTFAAVSQ